MHTYLGKETMSEAIKMIDQETDPAKKVMLYARLHNEISKYHAIKTEKENTMEN